MKTIGMIGGTSWESTQLYYEQLNQLTAQALGGLHSAKCILFSLEFGEVYAHMEHGDWDAAAEITAQAAQALEDAGADFLMLCAKFGYPCKLCYADEAGEWSSLEIDSGEQLAVEAVTLLRGGFRSRDQLAHLPVLPPQVTQETGGVLLYFTTNCAPEDAAVLEQYQNLLYMLAPVQYAEECAVPKNGSLWYVTEERGLVQAGGEQ